MKHLEEVLVPCGYEYSMTELSLFLPPCRGKVRMGVELWKDSVSTPTLALPLQGGGNIQSPGFLSVFNPCPSAAKSFFRSCN
jgi:hypothetical protein